MRVLVESRKRARVAVDQSDEPPEWKVLESGVLAVKTKSLVRDCDGATRALFYDPLLERLVCEHGWGEFHLSCWNGPRAAKFPKPAWTTCTCGSVRSG